MSNARYVSKYRSALLVIKTTPMVEYTSLIGSGELYGSPRYERVKTRHETHKSSVRAVKAFLESRGVSHACVERQALRATLQEPPQISYKRLPKTAPQTPLKS